METKKSCFLLLSYGGPRHVQEVEEFLARILKSPVPEPILKSNIKRYEAIGGFSPLPEDTEALAQKLSLRLNDFEVDFAFRFSKPFIFEVIKEKLQKNFLTFYLFPLTPFYSDWSVKGYLEQVREAARISDSLKVQFFRPKEFHLDEDYLNLWLKEIEVIKANTGFDEVVFTAHSLPLSDPTAKTVYEKQFKEFSKALAEKAGLKSYYLAYQSKGKRSGEWLEPDIFTVLEKIESHKKVLIVPAGFLQENVETLFDLDVEVRNFCEERSIVYLRTQAPAKNPFFVDFLAGLALKPEFWTLELP